MNAKTTSSFILRRWNTCTPVVGVPRRLGYRNDKKIDKCTSLVVHRGLANFSMDLLKELRQKTGAPIVDCKKALQNTDGKNVAAAMDWLREHGAAKVSSKVKGRETTEGLVALQVSPDGKTASLIKVSSETDFAGRSSKFVDFVLNVAKATLETAKGDNVAGVVPMEEHTVLETSLDGKIVKDYLDEAIVAIRENISLSNAVRFRTCNNGLLVGYVHNRVHSSDAGTAAAIIEIVPATEGGDVSLDVLQSTGKKLAMHAVAARPLYLSPENVPTEEVEKEMELLKRELEGTGKPPEIVDNIVKGKMRKFYEGICLTEQSHMIEDQNPKISKVLKDAGISLNNFSVFYIS